MALNKLFIVILSLMFVSDFIFASDIIEKTADKAMDKVIDMVDPSADESSRKIAKEAAKWSHSISEEKSEQHMDNIEQEIKNMYGNEQDHSSKQPIKSTPIYKTHWNSTYCSKYSYKGGQSKQEFLSHFDGKLWYDNAMFMPQNNGLMKLMRIRYLDGFVKTYNLNIPMTGGERYKLKDILGEDAFLQCLKRDGVADFYILYESDSYEKYLKYYLSCQKEDDYGYGGTMVIGANSCGNF